MSRALHVNETTFKSEVLNARQPVVVDFWAQSVTPDQTLAPILEEIGGEVGGRLKIVRVNVEENPALAQQYHIESVPTLIYFANGFVHDQTTGPATKQEILSKIRALPR
jgi:thioredoxin 1